MPWPQQPASGRPIAEDFPLPTTRRKAPRIQLSALPAATLRDLDAITAVDAHIFRSAVLRVLCDIAAVERATGQQVLCPAKLHAFRRATAHVPGLWPNATTGRR